MRLAIILLLTIVLAGCCLHFADLSPSTVYSVGDTIITSGKQIAVEKYQWANGKWTSTGTVVVDTRTYAQGEDIDISTKSANLHFKFDYPLNDLSFKFAQLRGNINIRVNNDFRNVQDIVSLDGTMIGGVRVEIEHEYRKGYYWYGELTLDGTIHDFSIGGQKFWVDDVCY